MLQTTSNLASLLFDAAHATPQKIALFHQNDSLTYAEVAKKTAHLAGALESLGIEHGERVGLLVYNELSFVLSYFALLSLGITVIPLNTRLTPEELSLILNDAEARWLISSDDFSQTITQLDSPKLQGFIIDGVWQDPNRQTFSFQSLLKASPTTSPPLLSSVRKETVAVLIYTSGTTGKPKGVMLSHQNLLADARGNVQVIEAVESDRFVTISPLFHVFGQVNILITCVMVGGSLVLVKKFSPKTILEAIERHQVTFMAAVPTMYQMMLSHLQERTYNLSSLRVCHSGAAPMPKEIFHQVEKVFGAPVQEGYGLSEASSIVTSNPLHGPRKPGSVGLALPGVTVRVMDETLQPLPPGEIGELHVQGDTVMMGYYQRPEETQKAIVQGWLKTKDMAFCDEDGYIHIVDRKDDLINIGGVKVYPREIEEILYKHPAIQAATVIGIPSPLYHEEIKAFIVLHPTQSPSKIELQKFCREHLAEYKIPKHIEFVTEIPQGATGKILRKELRKISH